MENEEEEEGEEGRGDDAKEGEGEGGKEISGSRKFRCPPRRGTSRVEKCG